MERGSAVGGRGGEWKRAGLCVARGSHPHRRGEGGEEVGRLVSEESCEDVLREVFRDKERRGRFVEKSV